MPDLIISNKDSKNSTQAKLSNTSRDFLNFTMSFRVFLTMTLYSVYIF